MRSQRTELNSRCSGRTHPTLATDIAWIQIYYSTLHASCRARRRLMDLSAHSRPPPHTPRRLRPSLHGSNRARHPTIPECAYPDSDHKSSNSFRNADDNDKIFFCTPPKIDDDAHDAVSPLLNEAFKPPTSLQATFHEIDNIAFSKLIELLPRLTEALIRIIVRENDELGSGITPGFKPSTFFSMLTETPSLPSRLERLGISWEGYDHVNTYEIPDFPLAESPVRWFGQRGHHEKLRYGFLFSRFETGLVLRPALDDTYELLEDVEIFRHFHDWRRVTQVKIQRRGRPEQVNVGTEVEFSISILKWETDHFATSGKPQRILYQPRTQSSACIAAAEDQANLVLANLPRKVADTFRGAVTNFSREQKRDQDASIAYREDLNQKISLVSNLLQQAMSGPKSRRKRSLVEPPVLSAISVPLPPSALRGAIYPSRAAAPTIPVPAPPLPPPIASHSPLQPNSALDASIPKKDDRNFLMGHGGFDCAASDRRVVRIGRMMESVRPENYSKTGVMGEETAPPWADRQSDQEQERHLDRRAE
ncbi:hypothetical protein B0H14DRAFT_2560224 [Mycena olivaceomarginata]|nr:hypothetical protein B0H14DRAFT_2560224 [Mycena olivaceomarginata]